MLEAMNYYIGLVGDRPMSTKIMMMFHEGDWRPGVGKVFKRWNEFFVPANPTMYEHEGYFAGCHMGPLGRRQKGGDFSDFNVGPWVKGKVKTFECHVHFEYYCDYFQDGKDRWLDLGVYEGLYRKWGSKNSRPGGLRLGAVATRRRRSWPNSTARSPRTTRRKQAEAAIYTTRQAMKEQVNCLADAGISPFWYFNYTDGFRPIVEKRWPDAISRNEDGSDHALGLDDVPQPERRPEVLLRQVPDRSRPRRSSRSTRGSRASSWTASGTSRSSSATTTASRSATTSRPTASTSPTTPSSR